MWEQTVIFLINVAALGVCSFLVFVALLPTNMGRRMIGHYFDTKIAEVKLEHSKDLGRLQSELDHLKDRGVRSNEKEYQAIDAVWESFVEAFYATTDCVVRFTSYPDLNKMDDDELIEFLESEQITGRSASKIAKSDNKNYAFISARGSDFIHSAGVKIHATTLLLQRHSLFIPKQLNDHFQSCILELNEVRMEQYMARHGTLTGAPKIEHSSALVGAAGKEMFDKLKDDARGRLLRALDPVTGRLP
jgi:hypothetical protein